MKAATAPEHRRHWAGLLGVVSLTAAVGVFAGPSATGASDPCAASEVARTVGSVAQSIGGYLDAHPETNQAMTTILQQQAGPQSVTSLTSHFAANPKVAGDLQSLSQPLTGLSTQCKLPINLAQALGQMPSTTTPPDRRVCPSLPPNPSPSGDRSLHNHTIRRAQISADNQLDREVPHIPDARTSVA